MDTDLKTIAAVVGGQLLGDNVRITGVNVASRAQPGDLVVVKDARQLRRALASQASGLVVDQPVVSTQKPVVLVDRCMVALIRLLDWIGQPVTWCAGRAGISETATLGEQTQVGKESWVGDHVAIGDRVMIGERTRIAPNVTIGDSVTVGDDCLVCPNVTIYPSVTVGSRVIIHAGSVIGADGFNFDVDGQYVRKVPHLGTVVIEDDVEIGANCCIDRSVFGETRVGRWSKLDNLVQIAHDVQTGVRCGFAGQSAVAGDTTLGDDVILLGRAGVIDSLIVDSGTTILVGSILTQDGQAGQSYSGLPARPHEDQKKIWRTLARLPGVLAQIEAHAGLQVDSEHDQAK